MKRNQYHSLTSGTLMALLGSVGLLLGSPAAEAVIVPGNIIIKVDGDGYVPRGPIWVSERFSGTHSFDLTIARYYRASIVVSTDDTAGLMDKKDFTALPIPVSNTGIYMTLIGTIDGTWGNKPLHWSAQNYTQSFTTRTTEAPFNHLATVETPRYENKGSLTFDVRVVMFCGQDRCEVPAETLQLDGMNLRLHNTFLNFNDPVPIMKGGTAESKFKFVKSCTFDVPLQTTSFTGMNLKMGKATDSYPLLLPVTDQGEFATVFGVSCTSDPKKPLGQKNAKLVVNLSPSLGYVDNKRNMAATTLANLGIVYDIGKKPSDCVSTKDYDVTQTLGTVKKFTGGEKPVWRVNNAKVYWGMCQNSPDMQPGAFSSTINYTVWLD